MMGLLAAAMGKRGWGGVAQGSDARTTSSTSHRRRSLRSTGKNYSHSRMAWIWPVESVQAEHVITTSHNTH